MGLSTAPAAKRSESGLPGPIFSGPHDCADLVHSLQDIGIEMFFRRRPEHFDAGRVFEKGLRSNPCRLRLEDFTHRLGAPPALVG